MKLCSHLNLDETKVLSNLAEYRTLAAFGKGIKSENSRAHSSYSLVEVSVYIPLITSGQQLDHHPPLQTSAPCERNWVQVSHIHSKKQRLQHGRVHILKAACSCCKGEKEEGKSTNIREVIRNSRENVEEKSQENDKNGRLNFLCCFIHIFFGVLNHDLSSKYEF